MKPRSRQEVKVDRVQHYDELEGTASPDAVERFHQPAYQVKTRLEERVTVRELIDYLYAQVQAQQIRVNDPVPKDLMCRVRQEHKSVADYLAEKYKIGGDTVGQIHSGPICGYDRGDKGLTEKEGEVRAGNSKT